MELIALAWLLLRRRWPSDLHCWSDDLDYFFKVFFNDLLFMVGLFSFCGVIAFGFVWILDNGLYVLWMVAFFICDDSIVFVFWSSRNIEFCNACVLDQSIWSRHHGEILSLSLLQLTLFVNISLFWSFLIKVLGRWKTAFPWHRGLLE